MTYAIVQAAPRKLTSDDRCEFSDTEAACLVRLISGAELFFCLHHLLPQLNQLIADGARFSTVLGEKIDSTAKKQVIDVIIKALSTLRSGQNGN